MHRDTKRLDGELNKVKNEISRYEYKVSELIGELVSLSNWVKSIGDDTETYYDNVNLYLIDQLYYEIDDMVMDTKNIKRGLERASILIEDERDGILSSMEDDIERTIAMMEAEAYSEREAEIKEMELRERRAEGW